jgi:penicillin-binding protein 2
MRPRRLRLRHLLAGLALVTAGAALTACNGGVPIFGTAVPSLPAPQVTIVAGQDPSGVAGQYLRSWDERAFDTMYALLSSASQSASSAEDFAARYEDFRRKAAITHIGAEVLATQVDSTSAKVSTRIAYSSGMAGDFSREITLPLVMEGDSWRIVWDDGLILPELKGGGRLVLETDIPARGTIYDRYGDPLAYESETLSLGVVPGEIVDEEGLLRELSRLLLMNSETIRLKYANALPDWYVPLGEVSREEVGKRYGVLSGMGGIRITSNEGRTYYGGGIGSHVVGYVAQCPGAARGLSGQGISGRRIRRRARS